MFFLYNLFSLSISQLDTLAEWLRRRPAKPLGFARVGSNPTGVVIFLFSKSFKTKLKNFFIGVKASMAQLAERSAVNRQVLGSIPSGGVFFFQFFVF